MSILLLVAGHKVKFGTEVFFKLSVVFRRMRLLELSVEVSDRRSGRGLETEDVEKSLEDGAHVAGVT